MERRIISTEILAEDAKVENSLRPLHLEDYVGQEKVKRNLKVYIEAARKEEIHLTMYFSMDLQDLEKRHLLVL